VKTPRVVLVSETLEHDSSATRGAWRFKLVPAAGLPALEVADVEPAVSGERLALLTVVRGLEALDEPSQVTLVTASRYVDRGIREGLEEWRRNGWTWESFGQMVPVKHRDLWQRMDRALLIHKVEVRQRRFDPPHPFPRGATAAAATVRPAGREPSNTTAASGQRSHGWWRRLRATWARRWRDRCESLWLTWDQFGLPSWRPAPWLI